MSAAMSTTRLVLLVLLGIAATAAPAPAQAVVYGTACGGLLPPPQISFTGSNVPGEFAQVHLSGAPPGAFVVMQIGFSDETSPFGPLPLDLNGIAGVAPGCQLLNSSQIRINLNAKPDGTLKLAFKVPATLGSDLHFQWAVAESLAPLSIALSRGVHLSIATNPLLHAVILAPDTVVDYDGDGSEAVPLDGGDSHTHEIGHALTAWKWKSNGVPLASGAQVSVPLPHGSHEIVLLIEDDAVPPHTLIDLHTVAVVPGTAVPGVMARYHDSGAADPATLLDAVPAFADWAEVLGQMQVGGGSGTVGGSPFTGNVLAVLRADVVLPATGNYAFVASGGSDRRLFVDGLPASGPLQLAAGSHEVEARFAVPTLAALPASVSLAAAGGAPAIVGGTGTSHDQTALPPVLNLLAPNAGTTAGGNAIVIEGLGFFPAAQVQVNWGGQPLGAAQGLSITPTRIEFASPPHAAGTIAVSVQTPHGTSNAQDFSYSGGGPVPVDFASVFSMGLQSPTSGEFGPDGRLYVTTLHGELKALSFDDDWQLLAIDTYPGVSGLVNHESLGLTFNPHDPPFPVRVYVSHADLYADGGGAVAGPSAYRGAVSVLTGPNFDAPVPLVTGLPQSNSGHAVNGLQFDHNGDLLLAVGCNTNAGVAALAMGNLPESPLSGAVLKALTSESGFNGAVHYVDIAGGAPNDDQRFGESVVVAPGSHVFVHAPGLRNPYDLVYTTSKKLYATDNGPNLAYGPASTGPTSQGPNPDEPDELLHVEADNYYGSANRARGHFDPRQDIWRDPWQPSLPNTFTQALAVLPSSQDGIAEYRADTFGGQLRGQLIVQKWQGGASRVRLAPDGRSVAEVLPILPPTGALDIVPGPGGALVALDQFGGRIEVLAPVDLAAGAMDALDIFPWRAPPTGGAPFVIGGRGFGALANTSVTIGGLPAAVTSVSATRIFGLLPPQPAPGTELLDVVVVSNGHVSVLDAAFRFLMPAPGLEPGDWGGGSSSGGGELPFAGGAAATVLGGVLHAFVAGQPATLRLDLMAPAGEWTADGAARPFPGGSHAVEEVGGRALLVGGLGFGSEGRVQIYDPAENRWSVGSQLPWPGGAVATAVIDGRLYAAGGLSNGGAVSFAARYDALSDSWAPLPPLPLPRHHAAGGTDGSRFFVFGGTVGDGSSISAGTRDVQVYDPQSGQWSTDQSPGSTLAPLPTPRSGAGRAVRWQGELYLFGGLTLPGSSSGGGVLPSGLIERVDVYDPSSDSWRVEAPLPTPRHDHGTAIFQGRIFVVGGYGQGNAPSAVVEEFTRQ